MDEIKEKEKDYQQLVQMAQVIFERSEEMTYKCNDQSH